MSADTAVLPPPVCGFLPNGFSVPSLLSLFVVLFFPFYFAFLFLFGFLVGGLGGYGGDDVGMPAAALDAVSR